FSGHFTKAKGKAEVNFATGQVKVSVDQLDGAAAGSVYHMWLVENGSGPNNTAAIDLGEDGDRILDLGELASSGSLTSFIDPDKLAQFQVDMAAVMRVTTGGKAEFVIGGMPSIRHQIGREAIDRKKREAKLIASGFIPSAEAAVQSKNSANLISQ